jgi:L-seryl-tRNA(Ser) seleniumtransferase
MKRRVLLQKGHEVNFGAPLSQMIRITGASVTEIGTATFCAPFQLTAALTDDVAAAVFVISHHTVQSGLIGLAEFCRLCRERGVPVIVDAAAEYDWRGIMEAGPAALVFSAQKAAAGPTAGVIATDAEFARACLMQERGIGRAMKAGKEGVAGAMAALAQWRDADPGETQRAERARLKRAEAALSDIAGLRLKVQPDPPGNPFDRLMLHVDPKVAGFTAFDLAERLAAGDTKVVLRSLHADRGYLLLDTRRIDEDELGLVTSKIRSAFADSSART